MYFVCMCVRACACVCVRVRVETYVVMLHYCPHSIITIFNMKIYNDFIFVIP